jgi:hypothetical protein
VRALPWRIGLTAWSAACLLLRRHRVMPGISSTPGISTTANRRRAQAALRYAAPTTGAQERAELVREAAAAASDFVPSR